MKPQKFETKLLPRGPKGAWTYIVVPFSVLEVFGSKAMVPVTGTINGFPFRNSLMPAGDGTHLMGISKTLLQAANAASGDLAQFVMELDRAPRTLEIPEDFRVALDKAKATAEVFKKMSNSRQREYVDWIAGAKREQTRIDRIAKAVKKIALGEFFDP